MTPDLDADCNSTEVCQKRSSALRAGGDIRVTDLAMEPTEMMPRGLPPDGIIHFTPTVSPAVAPLPKKEGAIAERPVNLTWLAIYETAAPDSFGTEGPPKISQFRIGTQLRLKMEFEPIPGLKLRQDIYEYGLKSLRKSTTCRLPRQTSGRHSKRKLRNGKNAINSIRVFDWSRLQPIERLIRPATLSKPSAASPHARPDTPARDQ